MGEVVVGVCVEFGHFLSQKKYRYFITVYIFRFTPSGFYCVFLASLFRRRAIAK